MKIHCCNMQWARWVVAAVNAHVEQSRFTIGSFKATQLARVAIVDLTYVRLRQAKEYCGNHAGACKAQRKHRKSRCLEGLDWVSFDDMLNDALDSINFDGDVASSCCVIRQGKKRRINYDSSGYNSEWDRFGFYENCCEKEAPASTYIKGTPGIYGWRRA